MTKDLVVLCEGQLNEGGDNGSYLASQWEWEWRKRRYMPITASRHKP